MGRAADDVFVGTLWFSNRVQHEWHGNRVETRQHVAQEVPVRATPVKYHLIDTGKRKITCFLSLVPPDDQRKVCDENRCGRSSCVIACFFFKWGPSLLHERQRTVSKGQLSLLDEMHHRGG